MKLSTNYDISAYLHLFTTSNDGADLAPYLRVVANELNEAADVLDGTKDDMIDFYNDITQEISQDFSICLNRKA